MPFRRLKKTVSDYFYFTRGQRLALVVLATALVMLVLFRIYLSYNPPQGAAPAAAAELETLEQWQAYQPRSGQNDSMAEGEKASWRIPDAGALTTTRKDAWQLHPFDPNTVSGDELQAMGFRPKSIATLMNYRNKGGRFRKPEDILKLYGLFPDEKERILPYVRIQDMDEKPALPPTTNAYENRKKTLAIPINTADTAAWKSLPGIGEKLSARIVRFRDALGGFSSIDQVGETYLLPDSTFQKIKPWLVWDDQPIRRLNINTASQDELSKHPYISTQQAKFIVSYRQQHGTYTHADVLLQTPELFSADWWAKTKPYLAW